MVAPRGAASERAADPAAPPPPGLNPQRPGKRRELELGHGYPQQHHPQQYSVETPWCPLADGWINKMWRAHTTDYDSAVKRDGILARAKMCTKLKTSVPSERSRAPKRHASRVVFFTRKAESR